MNQKPLFWNLKGFLFLVGAMNTFVISYLPLYFKNLGLTTSEIGMFLALGTFAGLIGQPFWGLISDKYKTVKKIVIVVVLGSVLGLVWIFQLSHIGWIFVAGSFFFLFYNAIFPLSENLTKRLADQNGVSFGSIRSWAAIGFALISLMSGFLFAKIGIQYLAYPMIFIGVMLFLLSLRLKDAKTGTEKMDFKKMGAFFKNPTLLLFFFVVSFITLTHRMNDSFISLYLFDIGGDETLVGWLWFIGVSSEAIMFLTATLWFRPQKPIHYIILAGWLRNQLEIQANGFSGHLDEHWEDVGPNNGWLGGDGDSWERGPYYLDGLLPLAFLLEDTRLIEKVLPWIEWTISSQKADGSFGPTYVKTVNTEVGKHDWWQDFIMLKVLTQYEEVTKDERVIPFMTKYFLYMKEALGDLPLKEWHEARGADLLLSIHWLYERTGNSELLELAKIVQEQTIDWNNIFAKFPYWRKQTEWNHRTHVVNVAMGIKTPAVFYRQSGNESDREAVYKGIQSLMTHHGQAHGMFSGDEWLSGTHPSQGVELCAVVEYMFSMENLTRILGDGMFGDILEKVAFNALPATISPEWDSHQYDQQVNQVICNLAKRPWSNGPDANMFGLEPNFGCCTANMHQGWPKLTSSLWMATQDGGLAAVSYAPCSVKGTVADGKEIELLVKSDYPFRDQVTVDISLNEQATFPLLLRVPGWCSNMRVSVNGEVQQFHVVNGYARLEREWTPHDRIELRLPMEIQLEERNNNAISVNRGPLVYVLPIGENWVRVQERERFHDWEVYPTSAWRYALLQNAEFDVEENEEIHYQPFKADHAPIKLLTKGRLLSNWMMKQNSAAAPPKNPKPYADSPIETIELVPYGCARLRIGEFPVV